MRWLARFLGWASFLGVPCYLLMRPYQDGLAAIAMMILKSVGAPARLKVDLHEPLSLGVYAAMCLSSRKSPTRVRVQALTLGVPTLAAFGLLAVLFFVAANRLTTGHAGGTDSAASRFIETTLESVPWVSAPGLWLVLMGRWELPEQVLRLHRPQRSLRRHHGE